VRAAAFARAAAQPAGAVMITRGGYGLTRLLPSLDFRALAKSRKAWIGYSDFTAFQLAMLARARAVTWSGPALLDDFAPGTEAVPDETTVGALHDALAGRLEIVGFRASGPAGVDVRGTLWGGNLTVLCSLIGTPWFPKVKGGILFLEDVGEHPYRIERMLTQLLHAGILAQQKAIVLGQFTRFSVAPNDKGFRLQTVVDWLRSKIRVPVLQSLPMGHVPTKVILPFGAPVDLLVDGRDALLYWG
jgi:muramoyltetrapeptide carboxypeptidase